MGRLGTNIRFIFSHLGAFFPRHGEKFYFFFPCSFFFFISGYFTTYKSNNFGKHLTQTLIVPYLLICMINAYIGIDNTNSIIPTFANILLGFHGLDNLILGGKWMSRNVVCLYTNFDKDNRSLYL